MIVISIVIIVLCENLLKDQGYCYNRFKLLLKNIFIKKSNFHIKYFKIMHNNREN